MTNGRAPMLTAAVPQDCKYKFVKPCYYYYHYLYPLRFVVRPPRKKIPLGIIEAVIIVVVVLIVQYQHTARQELTLRVLGGSGTATTITSFIEILPAVSHRYRYSQ